MLSPFRMVCRDFILPKPASYVFFYAFFNLRNLLYIITRFAHIRCCSTRHIKRLRRHIKVVISKIRVHIATLAYKNIFAFLMFPDIHKLYTKKQKALYRGAFRIGNHPCFDKKFRNTDGVHFGTGSGTRTHTPRGRGT